jgi:uncharacterized protein (TIGR02172 family)
MKSNYDNNTLTIFFEGKIDSLNAPTVADEINHLREKYPAEKIILDCDNLEYTTSAGLRVILRLKQEIDDTRLINVHPEIYDIFDMTGFTDMMDIEKAYRVVSVEGCEVIGEGANGKIYRIDRDTIVKVFLNQDALDEIHRQRELARTAFVLGIPTAIPFDVVRVKEGGLGSVYELLNATSYAKLLIRGEKTVDEVAEMSIKMLKLIHSKVVKPGSMPDMKAVALDWAEFLKDYLPADLFGKLYGLIEAVPVDMHMMHGDYHIKNVMLQNGESLLIDMDTLCYGHPIFELASMYNAYVGYGINDHSNIQKFLGIDYETAVAFWRKSLELYLGTTDEAVLRDVENKAKIVGFTRIMRRTIRRDGLNTEAGRAEIAGCQAALEDLLPKTDTLLF